jgi:hypothetical protein
MTGNTELKRMWKEAIVAKYTVQSRHLSGGTEEENKISQKGLSVSQPRFNPGTSE